MIEKILDLPAGIDGLRATGKVTLDDYEQVVVPLVAGAVLDDRRLRCLLEIPDFAGLAPAAAFEDISLDVRELRTFDGCAVVTDLGWLADATRVAAFLAPYPVRVFPSSGRAEAVAWLRALPGVARLSHELRADGVLVVEAADPLRVQDVEELTSVVDGWIAGQPAPRGVVLHAAAVPGWENLAALRAHLRFIRRHHRAIDRVAVVVHGTPAAIAARLLGLVVHPEVRHFGRGDVDAAITWAAAA